MKIKEIKKEIKGVFKLPKKVYYFGKVSLGAPYMYPSNYCGSIINIKSHNPRFNRLKNFKIGSYYIFYGFPITISKVSLGWKDKFNSPRYEWSPQYHIFMFGLQFAIFWNAPDGDNDTYYEMILHYLEYSNKDIKKAKETWSWVNGDTKQSTWNNKYLINLRKEKLKKLMGKSLK
jgi:hypothetical protein